MPSLSSELHYGQPVWLLTHVGMAMIFVLLWHWALGQGPLDRIVAAAVRATCRVVLPRSRAT